MIRYINIKNIFIIYLVALIIMVVLKGDLSDVLARMESIIEQRNEGNWNISLTPFESISSVLDSYNRLGINIVTVKVAILNIIGFLPMGFLLPLLKKNNTSFIKTMLKCLVFILIIEIIQFIACIGVADVDDVILNLSGCIIGYIFYLIVRPVIKW
ncbi:VanZ family protein [Paenibacillus sp. SC116]|uniref:VanZ family protein n=1 Tax=Paenibacillus sp. SC116 TaxID=2968986 RepID=UPI00215B21AC|nr:VanZ family protein [Paenibacillus sp. SC116]MCR8845288.1 VanZ family protein [Paenibacillus sp. SC116]